MSHVSVDCITKADQIWAVMVHTRPNITFPHTALEFVLCAAVVTVLDDPAPPICSTLLVCSCGCPAKGSDFAYLHRE